MKKQVLTLALLVISVAGFAQKNVGNTSTVSLQTTAAKAAPHYPKAAGDASMKSWVHKYPAEAKAYQDALMSQMSTATPDSKPYSDAKAEGARISQMVAADKQAQSAPKAK